MTSPAYYIPFGIYKRENMIKDRYTVGFNCACNVFNDLSGGDYLKIILLLYIFFISLKYFY